MSSTRYEKIHFEISLKNFSLDCVANINGERYVPQGCAGVYLATKSQAVFYVAILALIAAALVLLALVLYAALSQRARAGYAVVSRGQLK